MVDFLTVLIAVVSLIIIAVPGFLIVKTKLVDSSATGALSAIVLYVCAPAQVFMGFQKTSFNKDIGINMLIVAGLATLIHLLMILIMYLSIRGKEQQRKKSVVRLAGVFGNAAYMGLPFLQILYPNNAQMVVYASVVISIFNILTWTFGVYMITGNLKDVSLKKVIFHPVIIAVVLGVLSFVLIQKPITDICANGTTGKTVLQSLLNGVDMVGNMVTPLAMFVIGMRLANVNLQQLFLDKWAYISSMFKLVVMSFLTILITVFLPIDTTVKCAIFFLHSMPSAASCALQSVRFGGDGDFASVAVLLSTLLSIITIPLTYLLFSALL